MLKLQVYGFDHARPEKPGFSGRVLIVMTLIGMTVISQAANAEDFRAAGCYLPVADGVVLGINRTTNTIQLPMGQRDNDETARITAARETLEETGIAVNVGVKLLSVSKGSVHIFLCRPQTAVTEYSKLKPSDRFEVKEVLVLEPTTMTNFDGRKVSEKWRYEESRLLIQWLDRVIPRVDE